MVVQDGSNIQFNWLHGLWNNVALRCPQFLTALLSGLLTYKLVSIVPVLPISGFLDLSYG